MLRLRCFPPDAGGSVPALVHERPPVHQVSRYPRQHRRQHAPPAARAARAASTPDVAARSSTPPASIDKRQQPADASACQRASRVGCDQTDERRRATCATGGARSPAPSPPPAPCASDQRHAQAGRGSPRPAPEHPGPARLNRCWPARRKPAPPPATPRRPPRSPSCPAGSLHRPHHLLAPRTSPTPTRHPTPVPRSPAGDGAASVLHARARTSVSATARTAPTKPAPVRPTIAQPAWPSTAPSGTRSGARPPSRCPADTDQPRTNSPAPRRPPDPAAPPRATHAQCGRAMSEEMADAVPTLRQRPATVAAHRGPRRAAKQPPTAAASTAGVLDADASRVPSARVSTSSPSTAAFAHPQPPLRLRRPRQRPRRRSTISRVASAMQPGTPRRVALFRRERRARPSRAGARMRLSRHPARPRSAGQTP